MYLQLKCFWCGARRRLGDDHFLWCSEYPRDAAQVQQARSNKGANHD